MSFLDDLTGGLFGGGGSSSSVSSTVDLKLEGGISETLTLAGGISETIDLKPIEIKPLSITETVDLKPVTVTETIDLKPVTVTETIDLKPVSVAETIDLKPVAVDSCQTLRLAPLPETRVCNPYHHHVAMTMFGLEVMAMTFNGESEQAIHSPRRPQVAERTSFPARGAGASPTVLGEGRGIRLRVLDDDDD
jgi:hypothetical protein